MASKPLNVLRVNSVEETMAFRAAVAEARDPESEGGVTETHREKLNQLPYLRRVHAELSALIVSIEGIAV